MSESVRPTPQSACPPAANSRPSLSCTMPLQNILVDVLGTAVKLPVVGDHRVAEEPPSAGGPSQEITSPVFNTERLIETIGQVNGAVHCPSATGVLLLATVTVTGADVFTFPLASRAMALMVWGPFTVFAVFHAI